MSDPSHHKEEYLEEKAPSHQPCASVMTHRDSELTINAGDKVSFPASEDIVDVEHGSAAIDQEHPAPADTPLYGWFVVLASFITQMISMGNCNIYGVYQVTICSPLLICT